MGEERWKQIERIFPAAQEREASQRTGFLVQACGGDDELQRAVESLLAHEQGTGNFRKSPAMAMAARAMPRRHLHRV